MANKTIGQLTEATSVQTTDLFLLEQTGVAKRVTGETLINDLAEALEAHGGIVSSTYTAPVSPSLVGTMRFTMTDGTVFSVPVRNGANGTNGTNGRNGTNGVSPTIAVSNITGGHRLTITDANGTRTVDVINGTNGTNGVSPTVAVSAITGGNRLTITDIDGSSTVDVMNGTDGADGVTYLPSVSPQGVISWTNDGNRANPSPVNIKGEQGEQGENWYVYIKWAAARPTADADMSNNPDAWMGVYGGASATAPTSYTAYQWYEVKGAKGDNGEPITAVTRTSGDGSPGTDDTYTVYVNSTAVGTIIVHNGTDGLGTVNSINGIGVDAGTNNVTLTAENVGAAAVPIHLQATATALPLTINNSAITETMRVVEYSFGTPSAIRSDISWTTANGSIVLTGTMSGSTTVDLVLMEVR
jgi:hypothetical protein